MSLIPLQADCGKVKTGLFTPDHFAPSFLNLLSCISVVIKLAFSLWELSLFVMLFLLWVNNTIHFVHSWLSFTAIPLNPPGWQGGGIQNVVAQWSEKILLDVSSEPVSGTDEDLSNGSALLSCFQAISMGKQVDLNVKWLHPFAAVFLWTFQMRKESGILHMMQFLKTRWHQGLHCTVIHQSLPPTTFGSWTVSSSLCLVGRSTGADSF